MTQRSRSTTPQTSSSTRAKRDKACKVIICALRDAYFRVVINVDDDPGRMLQLLDARYACNWTVSHIAVQTPLLRMSFDGQDMSKYVDRFVTLFYQLDRMDKDAATPEFHQASMVFANTDPNRSLESTVAPFRTKGIFKVSRDYVATTLVEEYNAP